ncbi:MAG: AraC family transcriptional regulator [Caulobacteraceae bacterium]|nr:AraC family transcriptional regulator [Caulobacteraceae bacterium]
MTVIADLATALRRYAVAQPGESPYATAIEGMHILRADHPRAPSHRVFRPALCIVAQGAKWATFGGDRLEYRAGEALVVGVEAPSVGRVTEASPEKPCLVMVVELDLALMRGVAETLDAPLAPPGAEVGRGVFVTDFRGPLADCALRLVRLLDTPRAIPTLGPMIRREICYWLLTGPHGAEVARIALACGHTQRLVGVLHSLRERFDQPVRTGELAALAGMSLSAFHRRFKALTALTPLQYQKQLRLHEARRLMLSTALNAETAAAQVGYESPSQFSRDYARLFGAPPRRDVRRVGAGAGGT